MRDYYKLTFPITSGARKTTQKFLLIGAIVVDIGNFFVLIDCIFGSLYYLFLLAGLFILSTVMRVLSLYCNYNYLYLFNSGKFIVYKVYSLKTHKLVTIAFDTDYKLEIAEDSSDKAIRLYNASCPLTKYALTLNKKKYIIALDAYMYALLTTRIGKEDEYDLSR